MWFANFFEKITIPFLLSWAAIVSGLVGVDLSAHYTTTKWGSLISTTPDISFGIVHLTFYNATINPNAVPTLTSAWASGVRELSAYIYPCIPTSNYARSNNIFCGSASDQINSVVSHLTANDITFDNHSKTSTFQDSSNIVLRRIFVNMEDDAPNLFFDGVHSVNVDFLTDMVNTAAGHGVQLGIYTTITDWFNIMTDTSENMTQIYRAGEDGVVEIEENPFRSLPLWLPRYDSIASLAFFEPFAHWDHVLIKQLSGGSTLSRRIGSERVGVNYMDDSNITMNYYNEQELQVIAAY